MIGFYGFITCFLPRVSRVIFCNSCLNIYMYLLKVERRIDLVYGGGSVGLMGLISQAVHDGGRHVLGYVVYICTLSLSLIY